MPFLKKAVNDFLEKFLDVAERELIKFLMPALCKWILRISFRPPHPQDEDRRNQRTWIRYTVYVVVALILAGGYYYRLSNANNLPPTPPTTTIAAAGAAASNNNNNNSNNITLETRDTVIVLDSSRDYRSKLTGAYLNIVLSGLGGKDKVTYTLKVPPGRILNATLPDGSGVHLNSASSLHVDSGFTTKHRDLTLQGEGFFDVAQNPHLPFRVHTNDATATALGTSFNVRAYGNLSYLQIAVASGSVRVDRQKLKHYLRKDSRITIDLLNGHPTTDKFDRSTTLGWMESVYDMGWRSLEEVCNEASRCYNTKIIIIDDHLKQMKCQPALDRKLPVDRFLEHLKLSYGINYGKEKEGWFISKDNN